MANVQRLHACSRCKQWLRQRIHIDSLLYGLGVRSPLPCRELGRTGVFLAYREVGTSSSLSERYQLTGLAVGADGVPVESPFDIATVDWQDFNADVASSGDGNSAVVYSALDPLVPYEALRVRFRTVHANSHVLGDSCTQDLDCRSRLCVDGVCCDALCGAGDPTDCRACSVAAGAPSDGTCAPIPAGVVCRSTSGICDAPEMCNGTTVDCPPDVGAPDGTDCSDGNACNGLETCSAGSCINAPPPSCDDGNPCTTDSCSPPTGCEHAAVGGCIYDAGPGGSDAGVPSDGGGAPDGGVGLCEPGRRGDCDGDPSNGCEQSLDDDAHCGACGTSCSGALHCRGGSCVDPVVQVSAGSDLACALRMSGRAQCWGDDRFIGDGAGTTDGVPANVSGGSRSREPSWADKRHAAFEPMVS